MEVFQGCGMALLLQHIHVALIAKLANPKRG
jgi:hypothetical protein